MRRHRAGIAFAAALCAVSTVLAACTSDSPKDPYATSATSPSPGITANSVTVGYLASYFPNVSLTFNQSPDSLAAQTADVRAITAWVNANGGLGGRTLDAEVRGFDTSNATDEGYGSAACTELTATDHVFAVATGYAPPAVTACLRPANTLQIDESSTDPNDTTSLRAAAPYRWAPSQPEYQAFLTAQLEAMRAQGFLSAATGVEVIAADSPVARRAVESVVRPFLAANAVSRFGLDYVRTQDVQALGADSADALQHATRDGLDRVVVVGGARIVPVLLSSSAAESYKGRYAISTWDQPSFLDENPESIVQAGRVGMVGLGYDAMTDTSSAVLPPFPDPSNPNQVLCKQIVDDGGKRAIVDDRSASYRRAMQFCDATLFLKAVLNRAPKGAISPEQFRVAAAGLGTSYLSPIAAATSFGPGVYAGTTSARTLAWEDTCPCFAYRGSSIALKN